MLALAVCAVVWLPSSPALGPVPRLSPGAPSSRDRAIKSDDSGDNEQRARPRPERKQKSACSGPELRTNARELSLQPAGLSTPAPSAFLTSSGCSEPSHHGHLPPGVLFPPTGALQASVQLSSSFSFLSFTEGFGLVILEVFSNLKDSEILRFFLLTKREQSNKLPWASRIDLSPLSITQTCLVLSSHQGTGSQQWLYCADCSVTQT